MPPYSLAEPSVMAFVVIPAILVVLLGWGTAAAWRRSGATTARARRAGGVAMAAALVWMAVTWVAADRGLLVDTTPTPPPFAMLVLGVLVIAAAIVFSPLGARLGRHVPLYVLVGVQAFRFPLEVAMHRLAERGIMPEQMSYSGRNFDIVTGITAILVAVVAFARRDAASTRALVALWNGLGLALLVNIVGVAILSTPRFTAFGPDRLNTFIFYPPFVWLPAVMVLAALAGHGLVWNALRSGGPTSDRRARF